MPTRHPSHSVVSAGLALLGLALAGLLLVNSPPARRLAWRTAKAAVRVIRPGVPLRSAGGRYATSDLYLAGLAIPEPSAAVLAALAEVPPGEAIIFVGGGGEANSEVIYQTVSYLGWPRPFGRGECGGAGGPPAGARVGGVLFFGAGPVKGQAIGPLLTLVRIGGAEKWTSYCAPPRS